MQREFFQQLESLPDQHSLELDTVIQALAFNDQGLIPVIAQSASTKEVLMMGWMNQKAIAETLTTGRMVYWSRSRQELWRKGETSGHTQTLVTMAFDCDGDTILCRVEQTGAACHTGRRHCFYLNVERDQQKVHVSYPSKEIMT